MDFPQEKGGVGGGGGRHPDIQTSGHPDIKTPRQTQILLIIDVMRLEADLAKRAKPLTKDSRERLKINK